MSLLTGVAAQVLALLPSRSLTDPDGAIIPMDDRRMVYKKMSMEPQS